MNKLTIVLSGQICRENSANLYVFWQGFINIQNSIKDTNKVQFVGHSWNPEFDGFVKDVYAPVLYESEVQKSFVKEFMPLISPVNKFESGFNRSKSTWSKIHPNMLFGQVTSKTKSIALLSKLNLDAEEQILSTRWDIGCSGGEEVNNIIFDEALPKNYLYLAYFPYVDEGYADMWFFGPYKHIKIFEEYKKYLEDSLAGKNSYFEDFTQNGWMMTSGKLSKQSSLDVYLRLFIKKLLSLMPFNFLKRKAPFARGKILGLERRFIKFIDKPSITCENSMPLNENVENIIYPVKQSLNLHAILKHFVINKGVREQTRFLDVRDFEKKHDGIMVNPISFCYVIYSHSSFSDCWEMAIKQAKENLPTNCKKIYLLSEESADTINCFADYEGDELVELVKYDEGNAYTDRLRETFEAISDKFSIVYFVHEDMPLIGRVNKVYLNSLLHFLNNSNEFYVKLVDTDYVDTKKNHESFPGLVENMGGYSLSVQPAVFKTDYMVSFLSNFHDDIYGFEQRCVDSNFKFSSVSGNRKVGKYLLTNSYFPHIATAISKGKWCTSEWPEEIGALADVYNIELSKRGEC